MLKGGGVKATKVSDKTVTVDKRQPASVGNKYGQSVAKALGKAGKSGKPLNKTALVALLTVKGSNLNYKQALSEANKIIGNASSNKMNIANPIKGKSSKLFGLFESKEKPKSNLTEAQQAELQAQARSEVTGRAVGESDAKRQKTLAEQAKAGKIGEKFKDIGEEAIKKVEIGKAALGGKFSQLSGKALGETTQVHGKVEAGIFDVARMNVERLSKEAGFNDNKITRNMINTLADLSLNKGVSDRQSLEIAFKERMQELGNDSKAISDTAKQLNIPRNELQDAVKNAQKMSIDSIIGKTNNAFQASVEYFPAKTLAAEHKINQKVMDLVGNNFRDMLYNKNMNKKDMAVEFKRTNDAMAKMEQDKPKAFANKAKDYGVTTRELSDSVRRLQKLTIDDLLK